jgi:hypothetical protein
MKTTGKLIKLSDNHYIVVNGSEIKEGDWYWTPIKRSIEQCVKKLLIIKGGQNDVEQFKITHSTEPLEDYGNKELNDSVKTWLCIKPLSLSEVEEVINGYSVEKMALSEIVNISKKQFLSLGTLANIGDGYIKGFSVHKELVKDRLFTVEDVRKAIQMAWEADSIDGIVDLNVVLHYGNNNDLRTKWSEEEIIQSLLPKNEWECTIDEQGKLKLIK